MHFSNPGKHPIINKYKTNPSSPKYYIIFTQILRTKFWKIKKKKNEFEEILEKSGMPIDIP